MNKQLIECVPNFSEGRDLNVIKQITDVIASVEGVKLLDVDPGKATNRTVVTFVGEPEPVIEAAYQAIKKAAELIDMQKHSGEHPRFGATDVCPLVPIANISMKETVKYAHELGERVGRELNIPGYYYEYAATEPKRNNLAEVRAGEYEGIAKKIVLPEWKPDFGPTEFNPKTGNIAISARDFLIAYNVNLNTTSTRRANSVAFDVRESGRTKRDGNPITGKIVYDTNGEPERITGSCKSVKAIGWYIEEYGLAQISMNLTNIQDTPLHMAFEACNDSAYKRGLRVTGSELVGLVPLKSMLDAGKYFLKKQKRSTGVSEQELIKIAAKSMGLDDLKPFDPKTNIIEYMLDMEDTPLVKMDLSSFANETASESPAPGGGSISAYVGALGASLGIMVANLSSHKRGWDDQWEYFSDCAEKGQAIKDRLMHLVDEDTAAFNRILNAFRLPKANEGEKTTRKKAIDDATKYAIEIPFEVMKTAFSAYGLIEEMIEKGNPNSISDAAVGALCLRTAMRGAWLNVNINASGLKDDRFLVPIMDEGSKMIKKAEIIEIELLGKVTKKL
jgi:glutamate formiminotransferase